MADPNGDVNLSKIAVFGLGAVGGLIPILLSLLTADIPTIVNSYALNFGNYVGYTVRETILIALGGLLASLNVGVKNPLTLVQLGIAAPAIFAGYINSAPAKPPQQSASLGLIVSSAIAGEVAARENSVVVAGFWDDVFNGATTKLSNIKISYAVVNVSTRYCQIILSDDEKNDKLKELRRNFPPPAYDVQVGNCPK